MHNRGLLDDLYGASLYITPCLLGWAVGSWVVFGVTLLVMALMSMSIFFRLCLRIYQLLRWMIRCDNHCRMPPKNFFKVEVKCHLLIRAPARIH